MFGAGQERSASEQLAFLEEAFAPLLPGVPLMFWPEAVAKLLAKSRGDESKPVADP